jgi:nucleoside-specific outer membrane channel protein Tsx
MLFDSNIASFGELSFSADYNHVPRKAGVISDGHYGQDQVQINSVDGVKEVESSNM